MTAGAGATSRGGILGRRKAAPKLQAIPEGTCVACGRRELCQPCRDAMGWSSPDPAPISARDDAPGADLRAVAVPRCRYCGKRSDFGWGSLICRGCASLRAKIETGAMAQHSLATQRGRVGPATIADDTLLVTMTRRLRDADQRDLELDARDARKTARERRGGTLAPPGPALATGARTSGRSTLRAAEMLVPPARFPGEFAAAAQAAPAASA